MPTRGASLFNSGKPVFAAGKVCLFCFLPAFVQAQIKWVNADAQYSPLPKNLHVFKTSDSLAGRPFIAYYAEAKLTDKTLQFTTDTTSHRRITPRQFFEKDDHPLLVVNCSFFSYESNSSLNLVIRNHRLLAYNLHTIPLRGKDTFQYRHPLGSAIGIARNRRADIAWLFTDTIHKIPLAVQSPLVALCDSSAGSDFSGFKPRAKFKNWWMNTAVGGGPVLLQNGLVRISNEEELKFTGKAIQDRHPRTAMGYTKDGRLIILVVQGRFPGIAEGATLEQEAKILADLGCTEALNLDGGGSSCMLVNGRETIRPSEKDGERPVPAVFEIRIRKEPKP